MPKGAAGAPRPSPYPAETPRIGSGGFPYSQATWLLLQLPVTLITELPPGERLPAASVKVTAKQ